MCLSAKARPTLSWPRSIAAALLFILEFALLFKFVLLFWTITLMGYYDGAQPIIIINNKFRSVALFKFSIII